MPGSEGRLVGSAAPALSSLSCIMVKDGGCAAGMGRVMVLKTAKKKQRMATARQAAKSVGSRGRGDGCQWLSRGNKY